METFADVLHNLIDHVFPGDIADKAHSIIDRASGTRTAQPDESTASSGPAETAAEATDTGPDVPAES